MESGILSRLYLQENDRITRLIKEGRISRFEASVMRAGLNATVAFTGIAFVSALVGAFAGVGVQDEERIWSQTALTWAENSAYFAAAGLTLFVLSNLVAGRAR